MAIRLKKEVWAHIRSEYEAGASAAELVARYKGVKAASVHARAGREKWRDVAIPRPQESSKFVEIRATADGISIEKAEELEAKAKSRAIAFHRAGAELLGVLLVDGLNLASEAAKQNNAAMAKTAAELISSVKDGSSALQLKIEVDRIAFALGGCIEGPKCAVENEHGRTTAPAPEGK